MKYIHLWLLALVTGTFSACGSYQLDEEGESSQSETCRINVTPANANEFISPYPLALYLFDSDNQCVYQQNAVSEADIPVLSQAKGDYVLSVFSGLSSGDYVHPMETHPRQPLTFAEGCCADVPLIVGKNHIRLEQDTEVSVSLSYAVAGVSFSFGAFPSDVSEVTVHISPVSSAISLGGDIEDDRGYATVSCKKEDSRWVAGPVYVLPPSNASRIHLSVKLKQGDKETVYGYDYNSSFKSGNLYRFIGNEGENITLEGESQVTGWNPGVDIEFDFKDFVEEDAEDWNPGGEDLPNEGETVLYASELPEAESIWGPFYAWKVEPLSTNSVQATLLAPSQWLVKVDEARSLCETYEIDGIADWRVFSLEEAEEFRDQYSSTLTELSAFLFEYGIDRFNKYDIRYLCNDFNSTFCFYNTRILDSGTTVDYGVRFIKTVRVVKE